MSRWNKLNYGLNLYENRRQRLKIGWPINGVKSDWFDDDNDFDEKGGVNQDTIYRLTIKKSMFNKTGRKTCFLHLHIVKKKLKISIMFSSGRWTNAQFFLTIKFVFRYCVTVHLYNNCNLDYPYQSLNDIIVIIVGTK